MVLLKMIRHSAYLFCILLAACHDQTNNPYENNLGIEPSELARIDTAHYTSIQWYDTIIDFGNVKEKDSVAAAFRFKNTGSTPLYILSLRTSCGCTAAGYPKEPVMPGKIAVINVTFKTVGHPGAACKTINITANTKKTSFHHLELRGMVTK